MFSKHTFGPRIYSTGLARAGERPKERQKGLWDRPPTKQWRELQRATGRQAKAARAARAVAERAATTRFGRW